MRKKYKTLILLFILVFTSGIVVNAREEVISFSASNFSFPNIQLINNHGAYINILTTPNLASGDTSQVTLNVYEILFINFIYASIPMAGLDVGLSTIGGTLENVTGLSDLNGEFKTNYTAPPYLTRSRTFNITVDAYRGESIHSSTQIVVSPKLYTNISKTTPVPIGGVSKVRIHVDRDCGTEPDEFCVAIYPPLLIYAGNVSINLTATGGSFEKATGVTDKKGDFETSYIAPNTSTETILTVKASKTGYNDSYIYDMITAN